MSASIPPFAPGPSFRRLYESSAEAQYIWHFLHDENRNIQSDAATINGRTALEVHESALAEGFAVLRGGDKRTH